MPSRRQTGVQFGVDMMAACRADGLTKVYGRRDTAVHALREITLSIPAQAFTAIMGPSGSGKSTLLHCLAALDTPTSGRVFLGHTELTSLSRRQQAQVRRDRIGFVFQSFNLVPTLDAIENITLPQLLAGRRPEREWLEYVVAQIGLGDRLHHRPSQLSGGQQQRVALARALAGRPEVIFADEPTGNLDTRASREMLALLRSAVDDFRQTVVTVTHDPAIAGYADQVLFFTDGQVVDQVLQPETSLVLEHLQYLDSSTPAHVSPRGQLHASTQSDGQHTMRSRRRRRADETGPGRPMVGSDDEVEVARQERWLQRIREQFEVENDAVPADGEHSNGNDLAGPPAAATGYHDAGPPAVHNGYDVAETHTAHNGYDVAETHTAHNGYDVAAPQHAANGYHPTETQALDARADVGWFPAERGSWAADTTGGAQRVAPARPSPAHEVPWSRPEPAPAAAAAAQPSEPQGDVWHTSDWERQERTQRRDPAAGGALHGAPAQDSGWLPADRPTADDEWHSEPPATAAEAKERELHRGMTGRWSWRDADQQPANDARPPEPQQQWSAADRPSAEHWDVRDDQGSDPGWRSQPSGHSDPPATARADHPSRDDSWQRPQPAPYVAANDATPPNQAEHNGYYDTSANGYHDPQANGHYDTSANGYHDPQANGHYDTSANGYHDPQANGHYDTSANGYHDPQANGHYDTSANGYHDPQANGHYDTSANGRHDPQANGYEPEEPYQHSNPQGAEEPAPVNSVDLNSGEWRVGKPAADARDVGPQERGWSQPDDDQSGWPAHDDEAADVSADPGQFDIWSPTGVDETWTPAPASEEVERPSRSDAPETVSFAAVSLDADHVIEQPAPAAPGTWEVNDTHYPADNDTHYQGDNDTHYQGGYDPPPAQSHTATDPFEALQSLQSQLNRLGGHGRRPPRRHKD